MKLTGTSISFESFHEAQLYARTAKAVFALDPPSDPGDREKYTEGEWDLLFQIALRMAEEDEEWAAELVRSVVVPSVFMAALDLAHWFEDVPTVCVLQVDEVPTGAFLDRSDAEAQAKLYGEGARVHILDLQGNEELGD